MTEFVLHICFVWPPSILEKLELVLKRPRSRDLTYKFGFLAILLLLFSLLVMSNSFATLWTVAHQALLSI